MRVASNCTYNTQQVVCTYQGQEWQFNKIITLYPNHWKDKLAFDYGWNWKGFGYKILGIEKEDAFKIPATSSNLTFGWTN